MDVTEESVSSSLPPGIFQPSLIASITRMKTWYVPWPRHLTEDHMLAPWPPTDIGTLSSTCPNGLFPPLAWMRPSGPTSLIVDVSSLRARHWKALTRLQRKRSRHTRAASPSRWSGKVSVIPETNIPSCQVRMTGSLCFQTQPDAPLRNTTSPLTNLPMFIQRAT